MSQSEKYEQQIKNAMQPAALPDASQIYPNRPPVIPPRQGKLDFTSGKMSIGRATATRAGLLLPEQLTSKEFQEIGMQIFTLEGVTQWWIGDYLLYASREWGDITDKIADYFGRSRDNLYNILSVTRKFEISLRSEILTFGHHALVASKSPEKRQEYLAVASSTNPPMTIKALREYIAAQEKTTSTAVPSALDVYRKKRGEIAVLLHRRATPENRAKIEALVQEARQQLAQEAQWLDGIQQRLADGFSAGGDKSKETE